MKYNSHSLSILFFIFIINQMIYAQIGINTVTPSATLDVVGNPTDVTSLDGIIAPRLTGNQLNNKTYTAAQTGAIVYITAARTDADAGQTANVTAVGYYQFEGLDWQSFAGGVLTNIYTSNGSLTSNRTVTQGSNTLAFTSSITNAFSVDGTTFSVDAAENEVGIGTTSPENKLDVRGKISLISNGTTNGMVIINEDDWTHSTGNQDFGDGGAHFFIASREGDSETAGIYGDGDHVTIWSPGDSAPGQPNAFIYVLDEDNYNGDGDPFDDGALNAYLNTAGNWVSASDKNRKQNIVPLEDSLDKILNINTYSYDFKLNKEEVKKGQQQAHALGVIAQEVEQVLPDVVEKSDNGDYYVSYTEFIPVLIGAQKEAHEKSVTKDELLQSKINEQNVQIQLLQEQLQLLKQRLEVLESAND